MVCIMMQLSMVAASCDRFPMSAADRAIHEPRHFTCRVSLEAGVNDHPGWCELTRNTTSRSHVGACYLCHQQGLTCFANGKKTIFPRTQIYLLKQF